MPITTYTSVSHYIVDFHLLPKQKSDNHSDISAVFKVADCIRWN